MALPRRCTKCACYIAPQLARCPRCKTRAPVLKIAPTKEDRAKQRAALDDDVPHIKRTKIRWAPSVRAVERHQQTLTNLKRQLARAETPRARNALRSEMRACNAVIAKNATRKGAWVSEFFRTKRFVIPMFISPKGNRYVSAPSDIRPDLVVQTRRGAAFPFVRLQRFEKSKYQRYVKDEQQTERVQKKRHDAKKHRRLQKRKQKQATLA